jgi:DNA-binding XRE family transcriptional regulator
LTNEEFKIWREQYFASVLAVASFLDLSQDTIDALESGTTREGAPFPVRHHIALACMAVSSGLVIVPDELASGVRMAIPGRSMNEQTKMILARADGQHTAQEIADELKIKRKAVYAAVTAARNKGLAVTIAHEPSATNIFGRAGKQHKMSAAASALK